MAKWPNLRRSARSICQRFQCSMGNLQTKGFFPSSIFTQRIIHSSLIPFVTIMMFCNRSVLMTNIHPCPHQTILANTQTVRQNYGQIILVFAFFVLQVKPFVVNEPQQFDRIDELDCGSIVVQHMCAKNV